MNGIERGRRAWPGLLLGGLCVFFLLRDPNPEGHGLDAASPMAAWTSIHDRPATRGAEILAHPTVANLVAADPDFADAIREILDRTWFQHAFAEEAVLIHEQAMGASRAPGFVVLSRVGWRHAVIRLSLEIMGSRHLTREGLHLDKTIWKLERGEGTPLWVALAQGHLVICLHEEHYAIRETLDRLAGFRPRLHQQSDMRLLREEALSGPNRMPDRFLWLGTPGFPHRFHADLDLRPAEVVIRFSGPGAAYWVDSASEAHMAFAARFAGPHAVLVTHLPALPAWGLPSPALFLLMGAPYFWQVNELGVPAPLLIFPVRDSEHAEWLSEEIRERLIQHMPGGWTREPEDRGWRYLPDTPEPGPGFLRSAPPISLILEEYLIFSPAQNVVNRLLDRYDRPEAAFELRDVLWTESNRLADFDGRRLPFSSRMRSGTSFADASTQEKWLAILGRLTRLSFQWEESGEGEMMLRIQ